MELVLTLVGAPWGQSAIIGSSLGGFYATWLAERFGCRAVLINPAVDPLKDLDKHVGVTTAWHSDEPFEFKREYIGELADAEGGADHAPGTLFPAGRHRRRGAGLPRHGRPLRRRAPARDPGQRPCGVGI
jgi:predicted esterase YcpF (UPF0227 family)